MPLIEAVSISGLLGDAGTVAGIAAALVSAVLAAVVLGQGREMRRLREELELESERALQAEASLTAEVARLRQVGQAVAPAQAPAVAAAVPLAKPVASAVPSVPSRAGGGAEAVRSDGMPALGSATPAPAVAVVADSPRLIHEPVDVEVPEPDSTPRPAPVVIPAPAPAPAPAAVPATSAAAAAGSVPLGSPSTPAAGGISRAPKPPSEAPRRRSALPRLIAGAAVLAAVVFGVIWFAGSGDEATKESVTRTPVEKPGRGVIVAVLNGTPVSGLAGQVSSELGRDGFKRGRVATARDQQQSRTVVAYMPGHLTDAEAVSQSLGIKDAPVPADDPTQAIACPDSATCNVEVIVTVGADRTR